MMKNNILVYIAKTAFAIAAVAWWGTSAAQQHPERRQIRKGNRMYEAQDYTQAEERYRAALENSPASFEAAFNLADALYKQGKYEDSVQLLEQIAQSPQLPPDLKAKIYHNIGNGMLSMQKLEEAADCYKKSLRENPSDMETKYNLAYVQKLLEKQNRNDDSNDRNQNQDSEQGRQGEQGQDGKNDKQDEDNTRQEQNRNEPGKDGNDTEGKDSNQRPSEPNPQEEGTGIKREDAQNILDAMQQQEDKTREKVNAQRAVTVGRSGKNW